MKTKKEKRKVLKAIKKGFLENNFVGLCAVCDFLYIDREKGQHYIKNPSIEMQWFNTLIKSDFGEGKTIYFVWEPTDKESRLNWLDKHIKLNS